MVQAGKDMVAGLWNGISESWTWLKNKIKEWCGNIADAIKAFFGIKSPSKLMAEYGAYLSQGLAEGIKDDTSAEDAMKIKAENIVKGFPNDVLGASNLEYDLAKGQYDLWFTNYGETATEEEKE